MMPRQKLHLPFRARARARHRHRYDNSERAKRRIQIRISPRPSELRSKIDITSTGQARRARSSRGPFPIEPSVYRFLIRRPARARVAGGGGHPRESLCSERVSARTNTARHDKTDTERQFALTRWPRLSRYYGITNRALVIVAADYRPVYIIAR